MNLHAIYQYTIWQKTIPSPLVESFTIKSNLPDRRNLTFSFTTNNSNIAWWKMAVRLEMWKQLVTTRVSISCGMRSDTAYTLQIASHWPFYLLLAYICNTCGQDMRMILLQQFSSELPLPEFHPRGKAVSLHILDDKSGHKLQKHKGRPGKFENSNHI